MYIHTTTEKNRRMKALIDSTVKFRHQYTRQHPASIGAICDHLDDVYKAVQHENHQHNKSYSGIRAHLMSNTISLLCDVYSSYLLEAEILDSDFFILVRDVIARAFNETRHELVSDEEKKLLEPVCDMVLKIAESMTPELADSKMIPLFFEKTFVSSMADGLKAFATNKVSYGVEQKATIIKAILNMFSEYCRAKGDAAVSTAHLVSLVNAALCCVSSAIYLPLFIRQLERSDHSRQLSPKKELFLNVCPKYVVNFRKARREPMFVEAKHFVVDAALQILPRFILKIKEIPPYLLQVSNSNSNTSVVRADLCILFHICKYSKIIFSAYFS